jgi:microcin C transport system permease protein
VDEAVRGAFLFNYILKRILIMIPTLIGITIISFAIINLAPGSPIEQKIQQMKFGGGGGHDGGGEGSKSSAVSQEVIQALKKTIWI